MKFLGEIFQHYAPRIKLPKASLSLWGILQCNLMTSIWPNAAGKWRQLRGEMAGKNIIGAFDSWRIFRRISFIQAATPSNSNSTKQDLKRDDSFGISDHWFTSLSWVINPEPE